MNMGKIVNALKWMKISVLNRAEEPVQTIQDFSDSMGILRAEKCNGSGDCRNRPQLEVCVQVIERR
jgi:hypothetical protein